MFLHLGLASTLDSRLDRHFTDLQRAIRAMQDMGTLEAAHVAEAEINDLDALVPQWLCNGSAIEGFKSHSSSSHLLSPGALLVKKEILRLQILHRGDVRSCAGCAHVFHKFSGFFRLGFGAEPADAMYNIHRVDLFDLGS